MDEHLDSDPDGDSEWMSIGALSRATGVPVATLRSWERRYGFPVPIRRASGHRRYTLADVDRLRLIKHALEGGHRASDVVAASTESLAHFIELAPPGLEIEPSAYVGRLLAATRTLDEDTLGRALQVGIDDLGVRRFVHECAVPFLRALGDGWSEGHLGIRHEHFASARLGSLIAQRRRGYEDGGAVVVCAGLAGEHHELGLQLSALLLALAGARVLYLGADTPVEDIAAAATHAGARAVLIGSSAWAAPEAVTAQLVALRQLLSGEVRVAVGGTPAETPGVQSLEDFHALERWGLDVTAVPASPVAAAAR